MKTLLYFLLALLLILVLLFILLGWWSRSGEAPGLESGSLKRCPDRPNCVCSEYPEDESHAVPPIRLSSPSDDPMSELKRAIGSLGGQVVSQRGDYLAATFTSRIFGFVDDLELRVDTGGGLIHVRSASRVGYGDGGVNRERVEALVRQLSEQGVAQ